MVSAIEKLMGLVLTAIAVEMILAGLKRYFFDADARARRSKRAMKARSMRSFHQPISRPCADQPPQLAMARPSPVASRFSERRCGIVRRERRAGDEARAGWSASTGPARTA